MDTTKAENILKQEIAVINKKREICPAIIAGIQNVAHHAQVTSRLLESVRKQLGENYHISFTKSYCKLHRIVIWGGIVDYERRMSFDGDNQAELIADVQTHLNGLSTTELEETLSNLNLAANLEKKIQDLKKEIDSTFPALHYLRHVNGFGDLYQNRCG